MLVLAQMGRPLEALSTEAFEKYFDSPSDLKINDESVDAALESIKMTKEIKAGVVKEGT